VPPGVFGTGAKGLAQVIQDIPKQGEPNGYIVGREAGGAFAGVRYGSGTLYHKIEGQRRPIGRAVDRF
jgi:hypothetical protein